MSSKQIYKQYAIVENKKKGGTVLSLGAIVLYIVGSCLLSDAILENLTPSIGEISASLLAIGIIVMCLPFLFSFVLKTKDRA